MQNIVSKICNIIQANELKDIIILTPSQIVSKRLLALCAKKLNYLMGVSASTPLLLAKDICAPLLYAKNAPQFMERGQGEDLLLNCLQQATGKGVFPHSQERATAAILQELIAELDENIIDDSALVSCGDKDRTAAIVAIRQSYREEKLQAKLWDNGDLLEQAIKQLQQTDEYADTIFVTLDCFQFTRLEQQLLKELKAVRKITVLQEDATGQSEQEAHQPEDKLISRFNTKMLQTLAGKLEVFKCRGAEMEVRRILKDILAKGHKVDECAVVYLTGDYADAILTDCQLLGLEASIYGGVSFTENKYYYMYKALQEWKLAKPPAQKRFDGKYSGYAYNAEALCTLLTNQVLPLEAAASFVKLLREYKAGWGKERYEQILMLVEKDAKVAQTKVPEERSHREELALANAGNLTAWRSSIRKFLAATAEEGTLEEQKQALLALLAGINAKDQAAYSIIKKAINSITYLEAGETALGRLLQLLQSTTYRSQSEGSGKLLCASLKQAYFTGRKYLYVCGLSRFALQGSSNECPLLLDIEKAKLQLKTVAAKEKENTLALLLLLSDAEAEVQLSYNCFDMEKMIELQPSPVLRELQASAPINVDYLSPGPTFSLADEIKHSVMLEQVPGGSGHASIPGLQDFVKKLVYSASTLETAISCPFKFFMEKVLGLSPYEEPVSNDDSWLESDEMGSLVHAVLEQYYKAGLKPYGEAEVEQELQAAVAMLKEIKPLTKPAAMEADIAEAKAMIVRVIKWTDANVKKVLAAEQKFGSFYKAPEIELELSDTLTIKIHGSIDRLEARDEQGQEKIFVLDYKSGREYDDAKLATRVQPLLYAVAAEKLAAKAKRPLQVGCSSYLFFRDEVIEKAVPQDANSRQSKKKMLASLIEEWLMQEAKIMTRCPAFQFNADGSITGTAQEILAEEEAKKAVEKAQQDCYCDSCKFNAFCKNILNATEKGEDEDE